MEAAQEQNGKKRVCQTKNSVRAKGRRNNKNFRHIKYDILARRQPGRKISYIEPWLAGWPEILYMLYGDTRHTLLTEIYVYGIVLGKSYLDQLELGINNT